MAIFSLQISTFGDKRGMGYDYMGKRTTPQVSCTSIHKRCITAAVPLLHGSHHGQLHQTRSVFKRHSPKDNENCRRQLAFALRSRLTLSQALSVRSCGRHDNGPQVMASQRRKRLLLLPVEYTVGVRACKRLQMTSNIPNELSPQPTACRNDGSCGRPRH